MALSDPWLDSEEERPLTASTARFVALANCVAGIRSYALQVHGFDYREPFVRAIGGSPPARQRPLAAQAGQLLRVAWQTELAARIGDVLGDSLLRRVSAQTLPVQAYYSIFNGLRALVCASGGSAPTHRALQDDFAKSRAPKLALPWNVTLAGDPDVLGDCALSPAVVPAYSFNPMERSHEPQAYVWLALRMTRRWMTDRRRAEWLRDARRPGGQKYKRLPAGKRHDLASELRPTTILDFVYELRRQSQYESADEYSSDADDRDVDRFFDGVRFLIDSGLLISEALIARYVSFDALRHVADEWLEIAYRRVPGEQGAPLTGRLAAIENALKPPLSH